MHRMLMLALLVVVAVIPMLDASAASHERRVALVIGNNAYHNVSPLKKAINDARAVAKTLQGVGFEVIELENADRLTMIRALTEFTDKITGGGVGVLYYAGHGVQIGSSNYLIPVDVPALQNPDELRDVSIELGRILERLSEAKAKLNIVILDACRENPFPKVVGRRLGGTRGLTMPEAPSGILIIYSAGLNQVALDNLGPDDQNPNGLFTRKLLPVIREPGLRLDEAVRRIRRDVSQSAHDVGGEQSPAIYDQTDGDFYFVPPLSPAAASPAQASSSAAFDARQLELVFWESIKDSKTAADFEAYLEQYPDGTYANLSRNRLNALSAAKQGSLPPSNRSPVEESAAPAPQIPAPTALLMPKTEPGISSEEVNRKGDEALGKKDYAEAMRLFRASAEQGNAVAQHVVGVLYANGLGVAQDFTEATKWYRMAADQGLARAQNCLGLHYEKGWGVQRDYAEAVRWFLKAANQHNYQAQKNMSFLYVNGLGVTASYLEAMSWYSKDSDPKTSATTTGPLAKFEGCRISQ